MSFTAPVFLLFAGIVILLYYTVFRKRQWLFLLAASAVFCAFSGWQGCLLIFITVASTYLSALCFGKAQSQKIRRLVLFSCLALNLGILICFKYLAADLPLGMSFYTLQTMSYLIDAYRKPDSENIERNPFKLALFTAFFPQLAQGPMARYGELKKTLYGRHAFSADALVSGLLRAAFGFFKKIVIADALMPLARTYCHGAAQIALSLLLYAAALYCDFTGGIDIALGMAQVLGICPPENFSHPYRAKTVAEFWRRWHMTMGAWFRDYVFLPLSVSTPFLKFTAWSRKSFKNKFGKRLPVYIATLITWLLTGAWHGGNIMYILWGLCNGAVLLVSQELEPIYRKFHKRFPALRQNKAYGAFQVVRCFVIMSLIRGINLAGMGFTPDAVVSLSWVQWTLVAAALLVTVFYKPPKTRLWRVCATCAFVLAVLVFGVYGFGYNASTFIYTRF